MQLVKPERIEVLRRQVARIEQGRRDEGAPVLPFGVAGIDRRLPGGGLARGVLHEVSGIGPDEEDGAVPAAFIAGLCARLDPAKPVLWCLSGADLYGPGLAACGLAPERLILARARNAAELLWAMEEGLRSRGLAAVVGEIAELPGPASRRLQLAAETSGVTAFALCRVRVVRETVRAPNAAVTRWNVAPLPSLPAAGEPGLGRPRWRLDLWRARGAAPAEWIVEACDATGHVALPAALGDGTARRVIGA
ncbi:MAG TPA: damage-inducible protein [Stellaceae bacterium]|nr:damage-inducible protein [Stellaceae bacterium]